MSGGGDRCFEATRRFCWSVVETRNQSTGMEPENLDIEQINEDRRKAIRQNIEVISVDDLKALGERLFPYADHPWKEKFLEFIEKHSRDRKRDVVHEGQRYGTTLCWAIAAMKEIVAT